MASGSLEDIGATPELIKKACEMAMKAHTEKQKLYLSDKIKNHGSMEEAVFAFPGSWSVENWYTTNSFGETKINPERFPSMRSIGTDVEAVVNQAFARRFEDILNKPSFALEVHNAASNGKQIVFTGHSSGGPTAILATIWYLEKYIRPLNTTFNFKPTLPICLTFGSPLLGDKILSHALKRENWSRFFIHFVTKYDIIPRLTLAPRSSIEQGLQKILSYLDPKSKKDESIARSDYAYAFFVSVLRNSLMVASNAACHLMECTNLLLETIPSFISLSPYRPFGTYIFCTGDGKLLVVENSDAVLQLLFYSSQVSSDEKAAELAYRSLTEHLTYERELQDCLGMQNVVVLTNLVGIPLSENEEGEMNLALKILGLSERARLCLRAAGESEKQKQKNLEKIDSKKGQIREGLKKIQEYKTKCNVRKLGYYDAFKLQKDVTDFNANVNRLELAGIWDEIIEMLKRSELPDKFEGDKDWIKLGTDFRRILEPLDIANYYRHLKNDDTGPYMKRARPKRYRFTQKWLEHGNKMPIGSKTEESESWVWADIEELKGDMLRGKTFEQVKDRIVKLEKQVDEWVRVGLLGKDIFFEESTFSKWWMTLPPKYRAQSCIYTSGYIVRT